MLNVSKYYMYFLQFSRILVTQKMALIYISIAVPAVVLWWLSRKPKKFPPGPPRWPIVGNILEVNTLASLPHQAIQKMASKYGEVTGFYLGQVPVVVISGLDAIREAFKEEELTGRPITDFQKNLDGGKICGLFNTQGEYWREQRRMTLQVLRELGFGSPNLESAVHEEVTMMLNALKSTLGPSYRTPVVAQEVLGAANVNSIWKLVAGQRFEHSDPKVKKLIEMARVLQAAVDASGSVVCNYPLILKLFPNQTIFAAAQTLRKEFDDFIVDAILAHQSKNANQGDLIGTYLQLMEKEKDSNTSYTHQQLISLCTDIFLGSAGTFSNAFNFALLFMVLHPQVQRKIRKELDAVVGRERLPSVGDKQNLPFTVATLQEILRHSSVVPLCIPHAPLMAKDDIKFREYVIPKESRVLLNLGQLHMDKTIWENPEEFRPERFLDTDGKAIQHEALIPFGKGKRSCMAEGMATMNLFLFLTGLLQTFRLRVPDGEETPSVQPRGGTTVAPQIFKIQLEPRIL